MKPEELLKNGLGELYIEASEVQIDSFIIYLSELKRWNSTHNLTALKTDRDIVIKHFIDSLLYLKAIPKGALMIADAGSGAGFPGIPIKIASPEIDVSLIESSGKKSAFLRHIIRVLGLTGINVIDKRIEELSGEKDKTYDIIVSRATYNIKDVLNKTCRFLKEDGSILLSKGPNISEELKALEDTPNKGSVRKILRFNLPFTGDERNLVIIKC
jgi:16S rRNA (guanine527-N7)-methyltransferase